MHALFIVTSVSLLVPIVFTTLFPTPKQKEGALHAELSGWSQVSTLVTRALPYLTLYTQFLVWMFLYEMTNATLLLIAQTFTSSVFILYHGINLIDPLHLAWHPIELVREVVSWRPPFSRNIVIWVGLHSQHTFFPFYLKYHQYKEKIVFSDHVGVFKGLQLMLLLLFVWIIWHLHCWQVQGYPAYPFLSKLRKESLEATFYVSGSCVFCVVYLLIFYF
jgi:hypothetical protein